jgi:ABC-2 type transport system ATP-binding protein
MTPQSPATVIEVNALTKRFGDFIAVDAVTFSVERGEIFGYLGANGAGKSTTIRMLCGLMSPTQGDARVAGHSIQHGAAQVKRAIGYMSQRFSLYLDLTVRENVEFFAGAYGLRGKEARRAIDRAMSRAGLDDRASVLTSQLPGGIRQRLALATSLLHSPLVVFLDEPTAGVAPDTRRAFWREIRELAAGGTTVFVTTHHLDEAEYCHRVGLMVDGKLAALDTPRELKRRWVPGITLAVPAPQRFDTQALARDPRVLAAQPYGEVLRIRLEPGEAFAQAQQGSHGDAAAPYRPLLESLGLPPASCREAAVVEAGLEDVFLEVAALAGQASRAKAERGHGSVRRSGAPRDPSNSEGAPP